MARYLHRRKEGQEIAQHYEKAGCSYKVKWEKRRTPVGTRREQNPVFWFLPKISRRARSSKPASALLEQQRLDKIQKFFAELQIVFLNEITQLHIEQQKAELRKTRFINDPEKRRGPLRQPLTAILKSWEGFFIRPSIGRFIISRIL